MNQVMKLKIRAAREAWLAELKWLGCPKALGHRNNTLCAIVRHGLDSGLTPEQVVDGMRNASGTTHPLTEYECRRAVETVLRDAAPQTPRLSMPSDGGAFFREMMKVGVVIEDTGTLPCVMPFKNCSAQRSKERLTHLWAITNACEDDGLGLWWTGKTKYAKRDRNSIQTHSSLIRRQYATFIIPNPMTGGSAEVTNNDGRGTHLSWACKATVATAPLVVCEFDHLPPEQQLLFWSGVIDTKSLDVRSLVWSGNKSYHALVKVPPDRDRDEYVIYLRSILPGVDPAPMHAVGLTRLAGGINEKTGNLQRLVWGMP